MMAAIPTRVAEVLRTSIYSAATSSRLSAWCRVCTEADATCYPSAGITRCPEQRGHADTATSVSGSVCRQHQLPPVAQTVAVAAQQQEWGVNSHRSVPTWLLASPATAMCCSSHNYATNMCATYTCAAPLKGGTHSERHVSWPHYSRGGLQLRESCWRGHATQYQSVRAMSHYSAGPLTGVTDSAVTAINSSVIATSSSSLPSVVVGSSMEDLAWEIFGPTQMGIQTWEMFHLGLGVPWWISIPIATITIKLLLLPLTLKAKAASANFALASQAWSESGQVSAMMDPKPSRLQRWGLYLRSYRYLRQKYRTPRTLWYTVNSLIQIPLFITLSLALRRMSAFSWPGLTNEGILYFPDLTSPTVDLANTTAPYGPVGIFIPLGLLSLQMLALEYAAAARSPPLRSALEISSLTYFLAALNVPHATLLYWLSNSTFHVGLQHALSKPQVAKRLGLPMLLVNTRSERDGKLRQELEREEEQTSLKDSMDVEFLVPLGEDTLAGGNIQTALACFDKALEQEPHNVKALLGRSKALFALQRMEDAQSALTQYKSLVDDVEVWTSAYQQIATSLLASAQSNGQQTESTTSPSEATTDDNGKATAASTHAQKLEAAVQLLQHVTSQKPDEVEAWMTLGAAHSLMGNTADCLTAVDKAYALVVEKLTDQQGEPLQLKSKLEGLLRNTAAAIQDQGLPLPVLSPAVVQLLSDSPAKDDAESSTTVKE